MLKLPNIAIVKAGQLAEHTLVLPVGTNVTGIVVDHTGVPVSGSEVLVSGSGLARTILAAHTNGAGRFALRAIGISSSIGARARGYAPSRMQTLTGTDGGTTHIRIATPLGPWK